MVASCEAGLFWLLLLDLLLLFVLRSSLRFFFFMCEFARALQASPSAFSLHMTAHPGSTAHIPAAGVSGVGRGESEAVEGEKGERLPAQIAVHGPARGGGRDRPLARRSGAPHEIGEREICATDAPTALARGAEMRASRRRAGQAERSIEGRPGRAGANETRAARAHATASVGAVTHPRVRAARFEFFFCWPRLPRGHDVAASACSARCSNFGRPGPLVSTRAQVPQDRTTAGRRVTRFAALALLHCALWSFRNAFS